MSSFLDDVFEIIFFKTVERSFRLQVSLRHKWINLTNSPRSFDMVIHYLLKITLHMFSWKKNHTKPLPLLTKTNTFSQHKRSFSFKQVVQMRQSFCKRQSNDPKTKKAYSIIGSAPSGLPAAHHVGLHQMSSRSYLPKSEICTSTEILYCCLSIHIASVALSSSYLALHAFLTPISHLVKGLRLSHLSSTTDSIPFLVHHSSIIRFTCPKRTEAF